MMNTRILALAAVSVVWSAAATHRAAAQTPSEAVFDIRLTFLGTGAPRPSLERYGPAILLETDRHRILFDAGSGLRQRVYEAGSFELLTAIDHVVVSHLHYDHTIGLADLWLSGWLYGRRVPLKVQGPPGTKSMMADLARMYEWDIAFRDAVGVPLEGVALNGEDVLPGVIYERDGLTLTAFDANHLPIDIESRELLDFDGRAYGFRVDYKGRSVVFSGDTRPNERLVEIGRGVDVLVHETQVPSPGATKEAQLANVSLSVHTTPEDAAAIFERAAPKMAVYSHIIPPNTTEADLVAATRPLYDGPLTVAHDFMQIDIGESIVVGERERAGDSVFEQTGVLGKDDGKPK